MAKPKGTATKEETQPLLDLSTLERIEYIKIDGKRYDLVNLDASSVQARNKITTLFVRCLELIVESARADDEKPLSKTKQRELARSLNEIMPLIIPGVPPAVTSKLNEMQKQEIVTAFFVVRSERTGGSTVIQRMTKIAEELTGAKSSRASNGSTEGTLNRGMRRSRQRSSARSQQ